MTNTQYKPSHEEITARAREIYEKSGRVPGRDEQNWLQAEAELIEAHKRDGENRGSAPNRAPTKAPQRQNGGQAPSPQRPAGQPQSFANRS